MSEVAGGVAPEGAGDVTPAVNPQQSQQVHITEAPAASTEVTPEALGVDQASFDKYFNGTDFDWSSYGKEQAFKQQQAANKAATEPAKDPAKEVPEGAQQAVENAGLDWDALGDKISADGDISPEDYAALAGIGIPETVVKDYVAAVQGQAQAIVDSVIDGFGGQETFNQIHAALYTNATAEQRGRIDELLRDESTRQYGIDMAWRLSGVQAPAAQPQQQPTPQPSQEGRPAQQGSVQPYATFDEQVLAQRDPRYHTDPAYRNEVMARTAASDYSLNPRSHTSGL